MFSLLFVFCAAKLWKTMILCKEKCKKFSVFDKTFSRCIEEVSKKKF